MAKKIYIKDPIYKSLHSKMYLVTDYNSDNASVQYCLHLYNSLLPSNDVENVDVNVTLTREAAIAFRKYTLDPDSLINLFSYLCILTGKHIVKL